MVDPPPADSCCGPPQRCVFAKALLLRSAACTLSARQAEGEQLHVMCTSAPARDDCGRLAALLHERARFALRLPSPAHPLLHAQALRLQCGGLDALRHVVGEGSAGDDVRRNVVFAQQRCGSLDELPWAELVAALAAWQPPRSRRGR